MTYRSRLRFVLMCVGFAPLTAGAQSGPPNALGIKKKAPITSSVPADRPGFSDNTALVPRGHFEAEGGFRYADDHGGGSTYPSVTVL